MVCEYFATKRPGRKRDPTRSHHSASTSDTSSIASASHHDARESEISTDLQSLAQPDQIVVSPTASGGFSVPSAMTQDVTTLMEDFADISTPLEPSAWPKASEMDIDGDFTHLLTPPIDFSEMEPMHFEFPSLGEGQDDIAELLITNDVDAQSLSAKSFHYMASSVSSLPSSDGQLLMEHSPQSSPVCSCTAEALGLMSKLFSTESLRSSSEPGSPQKQVAISGINQPIQSEFSTQTIILQNQQSIEVVSRILQCSCADDGHLMTMISIIVFKILELYSQAARQKQGAPKYSQWSNTSTTGNLVGTNGLDQFGCSDDNDRRITTQLIMSELHRVRQLLNQLAVRRNTRGAHETFGMNLSCLGNWQGTLSPHDDWMNASFSGSTLGQIEVDLRRCLTTLSREIIHVLRES